MFAAAGIGHLHEIRRPSLLRFLLMSDVDVVAFGRYDNALVSRTDGQQPEISLFGVVGYPQLHFSWLIHAGDADVAVLLELPKKLGPWLAAQESVVECNRVLMSI